MHSLSLSKLAQNRPNVLKYSIQSFFVGVAQHKFKLSTVNKKKIRGSILLVRT
jgi:hypothetical protein